MGPAQLNRTQLPQYISAPRCCRKSCRGAQLDSGQQDVVVFHSFLLVKKKKKQSGALRHWHRVSLQILCPVFAQAAKDFSNKKAIPGNILQSRRAKVHHTCYQRRNTSRVLVFIFCIELWAGWHFKKLRASKQLFTGICTSAMVSQCLKYQVFPLSSQDITQRIAKGFARAAFQAGRTL